MLRHRKEWRRLRSDRRGAAAVVFGLTMIGLIMFVGLTVDAARMEFVRERLISSTDAAALAGGRTINSSGVGSGYTTDADNFFNANFPSGYLGSTNPGNPTVTLSTDGTLLTVSETVQLPLMFGKLLGHASPTPITYASTALAGRVEVAMVLDNSGSMAQEVSGDSQSKMTLVQSAANAFAASLTSLQNGNVRIAVVPFTATVNTGMNQASPPSWIDPQASYIYTPDPSTGALPTNALTASPATTPFSDVFTALGVNQKTNRFTLFSLFNKASSSNHLWDGCVEMRPPLFSADSSERYDVLDTQPTTSVPGSLFVPLFAPAEAKTPTTVLASPDPSAHLLYYNHYLNDVSSDDSTASSTLTSAQTAQGAANVLPNAANNAAATTTFAAALAASKIAQGDYLKYGSTLSPPTYVTGASFLSVQKTQSNFDSNLSSVGLQWFYPYGPNAGCEAFEFTSSGVPGSTLVTLPPVSHLSTSTTTVSSTINAMVPMGETYLPIGLFWGWEMVSPNSVFYAADQQASYNDPGITKAIILLTDGCDEVINGLDVYDTGNQNACGNSMRTGYFGYTFPNTSDFTSVGYAWQNRIGPISANPNPSGDPNLLVMSDRQAVADAELNTLCTNIKAKGVLIYAIGIDAQGSQNTALKNCATSPGAPYYYSTPDPANLTSTFQQIAASLTKVRLVGLAGSAPGI